MASLLTPPEKRLQAAKNEFVDHLLDNDRVARFMIEITQKEAHIQNETSQIYKGPSVMPKNDRTFTGGLQIGFKTAYGDGSSYSIYVFGDLFSFDPDTNEHSPTPEFLAATGGRISSNRAKTMCEPVWSLWLDGMHRLREQFPDMLHVNRNTGEVDFEFNIPSSHMVPLVLPDMR